MMLWQRTATDVIGLSTGPADLVVPAVVEMPIALQLRTTDATIKAPLDLPPRRPPMLLHILEGHLVRDALIADGGHQPIEYRTGVAIADCRSHLVSPELCLDFIHQGWRACEAT